METVWNIFELAVNLVQSVIFCDFAVRYFTFKSAIKYRKLYKTAIILVLFITVTLNNFYNEIIILEFISYILVIFISAMLFLDGKMLEKLFVSVSIFGIITLINGFIMFIFIHLFNTTAEDAITREFSFIRLIIIFISSTIFFYLTRLVIKIKNKNEHIKITDWIILIFIPLISVILMITIVQLSIDTEHNILRTIYLSIALLSVLILNLTIYLILTWRDRANFILVENIMLKQETEFQQKNISQIQQFYNEMRTVRHDLKQYSENIYTLSQNISLNDTSYENIEAIEKLKKYVSETAGEIKDINYTEFTGNTTVDSILSYKIEIARKNNINVNLRLLYKIDKISDVDITILLGNMVDNAIEACIKLEDNTIERKIEILITKKKAYAVISVSNTIEKSILESNPEFRTTKEDRAGHGLGMKSIRSIVKKYNGLVDYTEKNNMFIFKVMLIEEETNNK